MACGCGGNEAHLIELVRRGLDGKGRSVQLEVKVCEKCARRIAAAALEAVDQVPATKRRPAQKSLPGLAPTPPERQKGAGERLLGAFQTMRMKRGEQLGHDLGLDETHHPAFLNATYQRWLEYFSDGQVPRELATDLLIDMLTDYLSDPWGARLDPPYPFRAIAAEKVWKPIAAKVRERWVERVHLEASKAGH